MNKRHQYFHVQKGCQHNNINKL